MIKEIFLFYLSTLISLQCISQTRDLNSEWEMGRIEDGYKIGIWEYKGYSGDIELKVNYDKGTLIYLKPDTAKYLIKIDSIWILQKPSQHPRYVGSYIEFYKILASNIKYPSKALRKGIEQSVFLEFEVNSQGRATSYRVINDEKGYFTEEVINAFKLVPNIWIDARYNGESVPAKIILPFFFKLSGKKNSKEFNQAILDNLEGKKFKEVIITVFVQK